MGFKFSDESKIKLEQCDRRLQLLFNVVINFIDIKILTGHRTEADQTKAFVKNLTTKRFPESKHNSIPSLAIDIAPCPVNWHDTERFYYLAGFVLGVSKMLQIPLAWGGDWDRDNNFKDQTFNDLVHFEILS